MEDSSENFCIGQKDVLTTFVCSIMSQKLNLKITHPSLILQHTGHFWGPGLQLSWTLQKHRTKVPVTIWVVTQYSFSSCQEVV